MANWKRKILLNPEWDLAQDHKITPQELAASIAVKLRDLTPFLGDDLHYLNEDREDIAEQFSEFSQDAEATQRDFNYLMNDFYDWADAPLDGKWNGAKVCWIDTMTTVEVA